MYSLCLCLKEGNHGMHLPDTAWKIWEEEEEEEVLIASRYVCDPLSVCQLQFCAVVSSTAGANFFGEILEWTGFAIDPWFESGWIGLNDQIWLMTREYQWQSDWWRSGKPGNSRIRSRVPASLVIGPLTEQGLTLKENTNNKI